MSVAVQTKYGVVSGIVRGGHYEWRGIPYAKAPVGELRFKNAVECDKWDGIKYTHDFGKRPVQFGQDTTTSLWEQSEDCLYLNIWAPRHAEKMPVFVYIHGGAWVTGEGSTPTYSCESFVNNGMIGVNFSYRVGVLGFANFRQFDSNFDSNNGLSDILMALKWVKENIAAFGGDPENITICGESAGGGNTLAVLASPASEGLFHRAITMSGLYNLYVSEEKHQSFAEDVLSYLKIDHASMNELRSVCVDDLVKANAYAVSRTPYLFLAFCNDELLPEDPVAALRNGAAKNVETIFGITRDEYALFLGAKIAPETYAEAEALLQSKGHEDQMGKLKQIYPDETRTNMVRMGTDIAFACDTIGGAIAQSSYNKTYVYRMDYAITPFEKGYGAVHAIDIEFALANDSRHESSMCDPDDLAEKWDERWAVGMSMHDAFANFAKTGNPDGALGTHWPVFDTSEKQTMCIDVHSHVEANPFGEGVPFWCDICHS